MDEKNNNTLIKKPKLIGKGFYVIMTILLALTTGYLVGTLEVKEYKDITVSVDYEEQVFRDNIGKRIYPIEYKGHLYIPYNELGSYLNYMTVVSPDDLGINLISLDEGVDSKPLRNMKSSNYKEENITDSVFNLKDYNIMILWATWCPDCKDLFNDMREKSSYFNSPDLQLFSVVVDEPTELDEKFKNKVYELSYDIPFSHYLKRSSVNGTLILGNAVEIPKIVIFDSDGRVIKIINDMSCDSLIQVLDYIRE